MTADAGATDAGTAYCAWCGLPDDPAGHERCRTRLATLDPPRFCVQCARRMVVQVTPASWVATCSRHGQLTAN